MIHTERHGADILAIVHISHSDEQNQMHRAIPGMEGTSAPENVGMSSIVKGVNRQKTIKQ